MSNIFATAVIAGVTIGVLIWLAVRADRRLRHYERLPMQWSLKGAPTWSAPRRIALSFMPVLGTIVMIASVVSVVTMAPHPGQEGVQIPVMLVLAASSIGGQLFHFWMIDRQQAR